MTDTDATAALTARIQELEHENARLRDAPRARTRGRWRAPVSALCIVLVAILIPLSVVGGWARGQLVDPERFVSTLGPLADDPAVQRLVIDQTMGAIDEQVDFRALTGSVIDGIADLGIPPRAADALALLQGPAADGLRGMVASGVTGVVESDSFAEIWRTTLRGAHGALSTTATSDGAGVVVLTADGLGVRTGPIVTAVKERLVAEGIGVAGLIPAVDRTIIVGSGDGVSAIRVGYAVTTVLGWWLPVLTLLLLGAGIVIARRRSGAALGVGIAVVLGAVLTKIAFAVGAVAVAAAAADLRLSAAAFDTVYRALTDGMGHTASMLILIGVVIAVSGWVAGRSRPATQLRRLVGGLTASARDALARRGLDTGATGTVLHRFRIAIRVVVVLLGVLWLWAMTPVTAAGVALVVVTVLVVLWVAALLERPTPVAAPTVEA